MSKHVQFAWFFTGLTLVLAVGACGNQPDSGAPERVPSRKYFSDLALPSAKPDGLTYVKVQEFADPAKDGQRVELVFKTDTVYLCHMPSTGVPAGGSACPYPSKKAFRTIDRGGKGVTVYAVDRSDVGFDSKGGNEASRDQTLQSMKQTDVSSTTPDWFVDMLQTQQREG